MRRIALDIVLIVLSLGAGLVLESVSPIAVGEWFTVVGLFGLLVLVILYICDTIWPPSRHDWRARFTHNEHEIEVQKTLSKNRGDIWISPDSQSQGDTYKIYLGKCRVIDGFEFLWTFSNTYPRKWELELLNKWGSNVLGKASPGKPIMVENSRIVEFPATKTRAIIITIREPMLKGDGTPEHWGIEGISLREIKFFSRYIKGKI